MLSKGTVAEQGAPKELMNRGKIYPHMVKLQMISHEWGGIPQISDQKSVRICLVESKGSIPVILPLPIQLFLFVLLNAFFEHKQKVRSVYKKQKRCQARFILSKQGNLL